MNKTRMYPFGDQCPPSCPVTKYAPLNLVPPAGSMIGPSGFPGCMCQVSPSALKPTARRWPYLRASTTILKRRPGSGSSGSWKTTQPVTWS